MNIGIVSLGCAKNLVDSEFLGGLFKDPYFKYVEDNNKCDAIIVNTCGFIASAKEESITTILDIAKLKKYRLKYLIVTGCLTQRYYDYLVKEIKDVDLFIKIEDYPISNKLLSELFNHDIPYTFGKNRQFLNSNYSSYLRISDGCSNRCSYCSIPLIRGNIKSIPIKTLYNEALLLRKKGIKELNIVAQDTTNYGLDLYGKLSLVKLLKKLDTIDFKWIRILYMYPDEITDDLLLTIKKSKRILPYFDIPVQYGNDKVLKLMNRRGNIKTIKNIIFKIRNMFDNAIIRTTFIVGFPGETNKTFKDTINFINEIKFDSLGAFVYSKEEDTKAYSFTNHVSKKLSYKRFDILMRTQKDILTSKMKCKIGKTYQVIVDKYDKEERINYCRTFESAPDDIDYYVLVHGKKLTIGSFYNVLITHYVDYDFIGKII